MGSEMCIRDSAPLLAGIRVNREPAQCQCSTPRHQQEGIEATRALVLAKQWNQHLQQRCTGLKPLGHPMDGLRAMQQLITVDHHSTITQMTPALSQRLAQGMVSAAIANA